MRGDWKYEAMQYRDIDREAQRQAEMEILLQEAQELRPALLRQLGYVPECVLEFCNRARQLIGGGK